MTERRMRPHFHGCGVEPRSKSRLGQLRRACDLLRAPYLFLSLFRSPISLIVTVLGCDLRDQLP